VARQLVDRFGSVGVLALYAHRASAVLANADAARRDPQEEHGRVGAR
jgi:hypothetical protein